jgi:hypothetical protein
MEKLSKYENQQRERQRMAIQQLNEIERMKKPEEQRYFRLKPNAILRKLIPALGRR